MYVNATKNILDIPCHLINQSLSIYSYIYQSFR